MSATEIANITVSKSETRSVSEIASLATKKVVKFADKYGVRGQFDETKLEEDLIFFLVKSKTVRIEELEISIMEDGSTSVGGTITGRRLADLILRISYSDERRGF
jgi:hypothetical protein